VQNFECRGSVQLRQTVFGDDRIPFFAGKGGAHRVGILHAFRVHIVPALLEETHDRSCVVLGIFYLQDA
jgi:hypothetical protein